MARGCCLNIASREKLFVLSLFLELLTGLRVESGHLVELFGGQLSQVSDEVHELPRVGIVASASTPCRHACQADSIFDDPIQFAIGERLSVGETHVRSLRV